MNFLRRLITDRRFTLPPHDLVILDGSTIEQWGRRVAFEAEPPATLAWSRDGWQWRPWPTSGTDNRILQAPARRVAFLGWPPPTDDLAPLVDGLRARGLLHGVAELRCLHAEAWTTPHPIVTGTRGHLTWQTPQRIRGHHIAVGRVLWVPAPPPVDAAMESEE